LPDKAVRLGQLITNPRKPAEIVGNGPLEIPDSPTHLEERTEEDVVFQKMIGRAAGLGFSAAVLSYLPFGIAGDTQRGTGYQYEIKKVHETVFRPSNSYVQQSVFQSDVLKYLAENGYRKSIYMIVGIRVGCDAIVTHSRDSKMGGKLSATVPGASLGIPVDLGVKAQLTQKETTFEQKRIPDSFVFAYRLREIRYFKKTKSTRDLEFARGADLHDLHGGTSIRHYTSSETIYLGTPDEIEIDGISGRDYEEDEDDSNIIGGCVIVPAEE
jgi:hypothetical protein